MEKHYLSMYVKLNECLKEGHGIVTQLVLGEKWDLQQRNMNKELLNSSRVLPLCCIWVTHTNKMNAGSSALITSKLS